MSHRLSAGTVGFQDLDEKGPADLDTASMPTGFYQITYEFPEKMNRGFSRTDGRWEGSIAECLVFDAKLSENERKGVEEYLRRKWISAAHLTN